MKGAFEKRFWKVFLALALLVGFVLRWVFVEDMEYKEDEEYNFIQTQLIGNSQPWPWYGIPSGVYIVNPGMSIWVFTILAKVFRIHSPTGLAHAVQLFALFGMCLILPFAWKILKDFEERRLWYWAFALAMVNPFLVLYQRKLWPEPFLPFFSMLMLIGWWRKEARWGAFVWGLAGACVGQVHMSGFFLAAGLFVWTGLFTSSVKRTGINWKYWFFGSVVGALPLIPWFWYIVTHPVNHAVTTGWGEAIQLKYWVFWLTDSLGLHLGNPLGLLRGPSHWDQLSDFVRYPVVSGHATYLVGIAHAGALVAAVLVFGRGMAGIWRRRFELGSVVIGRDSPTAFVQNSALWACGILMTLTGIMIRRYYMTVTFPLEFIFLARMAGPETRSGHRLLLVLWICQLVMSAGFVHYIHVNQGSTMGDYGQGYSLARKTTE